jgi:hypothetical protein
MNHPSQVIPLNLSKRDTLRAASGIADEAVLDQLIALDIQSETVAALSLIPLLEVAWADGGLETSERQAILDGAQTLGLRVGNASYALLKGRLDQRPDPALLTAWQAYQPTGPQACPLGHGTGTKQRPCAMTDISRLPQRSCEVSLLPPWAG